jgi:hypothetical protein
MKNRVSVGAKSIALLVSFLPLVVQAQALSTDPQGSGVIISAVRWLQEPSRRWLR